MKFKRIYKLLALTLIAPFILSGCSEYTKEYRNNPALEYIENSDIMKERDYGITEGIYYAAFSIYDESLDSEDFENIAECIYLEITGLCYKGGQPEKAFDPNMKFSLAFYKDDTDERLDAFMYQSGERLAPTDKDVFYAGDRFDLLTGDEESE